MPSIFSSIVLMTSRPRRPRDNTGRLGGRPGYELVVTAPFGSVTTLRREEPFSSAVLPGREGSQPVRIIVNHAGRNFHPRMTVGGATTILRPGTLGDVLIAGVGVEAPHVAVLPRPRAGRLTVEDLTPNGGPYQLGAVVALHGAHPGHGMDFETHRYEGVEVVERWDGKHFWAFNASLACTSLAEIFGHRLRVDRGRTVFLPSRSATRPGGIFKPHARPFVYVNEGGYVRCELRDPHLGSVNIGVSDHRFFETHGWDVQEQDIIKSDVIEEVNRRIRVGVDVLLGLCVIYVFPAEHPHQRLTVSGVHLPDDPYWGDR